MRCAYIHLSLLVFAGVSSAEEGVVKIFTPGREEAKRLVQDGSGVDTSPKRTTGLGSEHTAGGLAHGEIEFVDEVDGDNALPGTTGGPIGAHSATVSTKHRVPLPTESPSNELLADDGGLELFPPLQTSSVGDPDLSTMQNELNTLEDAVDGLELHDRGPPHLNWNAFSTRHLEHSPSNGLSEGEGARKGPIGGSVGKRTTTQDTGSWSLRQHRLPDLSVVTAAVLEMDREDDGHGHVPPSSSTSHSRRAKPTVDELDE